MLCALSRSHFAANETVIVTTNGTTNMRSSCVETLVIACVHVCMCFFFLVCMCYIYVCMCECVCNKWLDIRQSPILRCPILLLSFVALLAQLCFRAFTHTHLCIHIRFLYITTTCLSYMAFAIAVDVLLLLLLYLRSGRHHFSPFVVVM